ncbi:lysophospholipid acyltransferase 1 isoform X3 [Chiloscyllium plagiosum]|uniref:lysophospholipid acyltransferase 1 isoform X3 n=1 Tax=Chiloscyllium plagiosum TaxID=36176 RepID=UPI001CB7E0D3|nr:lysophospholipid acyltransferase 1 isoform X3 [Chiloscyllium plagiosum]
MAEPPTIPFRTTGSRLLHPLSVRFNVPLDQVNFAVCQLFALFAAFWFRLYLSPSRAGVVVRHVVITMLGIYFAIFCFGWYSLHIFMEVSLCYCIMITANVSNIHRYSFVAAMGYLTLCQISRVYIFNYGLLATDFSGPLMIVTQKITSLAFQMHDGLGRKEEELTVEQRRLAVSSRPTLLEYCSYHLNFLGILAGPASNYKDYIAFIEGNHIDMKLIEEHWKQKGFSKFPDPSPLRAVANKMVITFICLVWFTLITKNFPISYNVDDKFISEASFFRKLCYLFLSVHASRPKYYFAWTLADAVNNAGGFGFNGLDKNGNLRWDLISNLNIWNIEMRSNFRHYFLSSRKMKIGYDVMTWVFTQLALCYIVTPFLLLGAEPTIKFYKSIYFHFHILCAIVLPILAVKKRKSIMQTTSLKANSSNPAPSHQQPKKEQ